MPSVLRPLVISAGLTISLAPPALAQFSLDANFDHGSLAAYAVNGSNITLAGRTNYFGSARWRWMYFKATGVQNATPTFTINQNFAGDSTPGPHELDGHSFVYSYDNQNWSFFTNNSNQTNLTPDRFVFSNSTPFTQNTVYVAYAIPYSYGDSVAHTQSVLASPWASPTKSANANGVIGQTRPGTDDLGRAVLALDLFAYHITDPSVPASAKRKVGLATGLHAGEPLGTHTYEGLVNFLISDDPRAAQLRKAVDFFCYPVLNPSGRYAGLNRSTVTNINTDPNGLWNEDVWDLPANDVTYADIRTTGKAMIADVRAYSPAGLDAFIDFHSTVPDYANPTNLPHDFGFISTADANTDWWQLVQQLNNGNLIQYANSGSGENTSTGFARDELGAQVEITLETQFSWERNTDYYHNLGKSFGLAWYQTWAQPVPIPDPTAATLLPLAACGLATRRARRRS